MAIETIYAEAFFESVLNNDATLMGATALNGQKFYKYRAKQGATYPLGIYNIQSPGDINTGNATRLFTRPLFQSRIVGKVVNGVLQSASNVRVSSHRMDEVLRNIRRQVLVIDGLTLYFNVWREDELVPREEPGETSDVVYRNYGGLYRCELSP